MTLPRHWIALIFAGALCGAAVRAVAQEETGGAGAGSGTGSSSSGGGSGTGASSAFGTPATGGATTPTAPPTTTAPPPAQPGSEAPAPATGPLTAPTAPGLFGTSPTGTAPPATGAPAAASTLGAGTGGPQPPVEAPPSFTVPSAYGQAAQTLTAGQGVLARPRFRYNASIQVGYDDNVLQTPTKSQEIPQITQEVLVDPGTPDRVVLEQVPQTQTGPGGIILGPQPTAPTFRTRVIPGRPAEFETIVLQERIPPQERIGSFFARTSASLDIQMASRRQVFTFDLRANADYYFSRPTDQTDVNGSLSFVYARRISPRMQFSATANLAYLSQPDVRRLNAPSRNVGDYFNGSAKADLSYRWTKRFSTVASVSLNTLLYMQETQETGNYYETTFGTEARYLWSPRLTVLGEVRYSQIAYSRDPLRDSHTLYLLAGAELALTSRFSTSLRLGESLRTFEESGQQAMTPYAEITARWRYAPAGFLSVNTRFGFEEPGDANSTVQSLRLGLTVTHALSSRMRASAGLTLIHTTTTTETSDLSLTSDTIDFNLGVEYALTRRLSLNSSYVFTQVISDTETSDYYRNRIFFGAEYSF